MGPVTQKPIQRIIYWDERVSKKPYRDEHWFIVIDDEINRYNEKTINPKTFEFKEGDLVIRHRKELMAELVSYEESVCGKMRMEYVGKDGVISSPGRAYNKNNIALDWYHDYYDFKESPNYPMEKSTFELMRYLDRFWDEDISPEDAFDKVTTYIDEHKLPIPYKTPNPYTDEVVNGTRTFMGVRVTDNVNNHMIALLNHIVNEPFYDTISETLMKYDAHTISETLMKYDAQMINEKRTPSSDAFILDMAFTELNIEELYQIEDYDPARIVAKVSECADKFKELTPIIDMANDNLDHVEAINRLKKLTIDDELEKRLHYTPDKYDELIEIAKKLDKNDKFFLERLSFAYDHKRWRDTDSIDEAIKMAEKDMRAFERKARKMEKKFPDAEAWLDNYAKELKKEQKWLNKNHYKGNFYSSRAEDENRDKRLAVRRIKETIACGKQIGADFSFSGTVYMVNPPEKKEVLPSDRFPFKYSPEPIHILKELIPRTYLEKRAELGMDARLRQQKYVTPKQEPIKSKEDKQMTTVNISEIAKKIGNEPSEVTLPNGQTRQAVNWDKETATQAVKEVYQLSSEGQKVVIDGPAPAWFASALTHTVHPCPVGLNDPKVGVIDIPSLPHGDLNPAGEVSFTVTEGEKFVKLEWQIDNGTVPPVYDHENLKNIVVPEISDGKEVVISGRGPNYINVALGEAYAHTNKSVSYFQPQTKGYTIGITHTRDRQIGDLIPAEEVEQDINKPEKDISKSTLSSIRKGIEHTEKDAPDTEKDEPDYEDTEI